MSSEWWRSAVVYQIYPRSFADDNDDGVGDLAGMVSRLDHLARLGVDAVWVSPWYPSPLVDGGYDVSDYCGIHPDLGTLADADAFIAGCHARGLRVLIDLVPNHTSDRHPWFREAVRAGPGSPERARYVFRDGRGPGGAEPPTNWPSLFGGGAWERIVEPDGSPGQWYLHLFAPQQPDLDWANPVVADLFDDILRFWFDRGVDGFRIDVADSLCKDQAFPDLATSADGRVGVRPGAEHPYWDRPELAAVQRRWRALADSYPEPRVFVSEANAPGRMAYLATDRLHTTFTFDSLWCEWDAASLRHMVDRNLAEHAAVGASTTWLLGNHDVARPATRYGKRITGWPFPEGAPAPEESRVWSEHLYPWPTDVIRGRRRARAAALFQLALPGGVYIYQGEELGLEEVEDLPIHTLQDPVFWRTRGRARGRDGCRVPLPWSGGEPPFGFSATAEPWLPQPAHWRGFTVEAEAQDPTSTLALYTTALRIRRAHPALGEGTMTWDPATRGPVLALRREPGFCCVVNTGVEPVPLPPGEVMVASDAVRDGLLPGDAAVWLSC